MRISEPGTTASETEAADDECTIFRIAEDKNVVVLSVVFVSVQFIEYTLADFETIQNLFASK